MLLSKTNLSYSKNVQNTSMSVLVKLYINYNKNEVENEK